MNHLLVGAADKTERLLALAESDFFLIDDGTTATTFAAAFPTAREFHVDKHHFNPLRDINYKRARDIATTIYAAYPGGHDTLTVRNGKRALTRLLLDGAEYIDRLPRKEDPGSLEALAAIDDLLLSPVLKEVLSKPTDSSFKGQVIVRLDRAELGDFDAFVLASLLLGQAQGQVIIPDLGFYGRDFHVPLIRQGRLTAGVFSLDELTQSLRRHALLIKNKEGHQCTAEDAETLADYCSGFPRGTDGHTTYMQQAMRA